MNEKSTPKRVGEVVGAHLACYLGVALVSTIASYTAGELLIPQSLYRGPLWLMFGTMVPYYGAGAYLILAILFSVIWTLRRKDALDAVVPTAATAGIGITAYFVGLSIAMHYHLVH